MSSTNNTFSIKQLGTITTTNGFSLTLDERYIEGLVALEGFSHIVVLWVAHAANEGALTISKPYTDGPDEVGVFSTRSEFRPNQLGLSIAPVVAIDRDKGVIQLAWIDTLHDTPVVDIKPYFPASDRVASAQTPQWCSHWPQNLEESATFDWESVFT